MLASRRNKTLISHGVAIHLKMVGGSPIITQTLTEGIYDGRRGENVEHRGRSAEQDLRTDRRGQMKFAGKRASLLFWVSLYPPPPVLPSLHLSLASAAFSLAPPRSPAPCLSKAFSSRSVPACLCPSRPQTHSGLVSATSL